MQTGEVFISIIVSTYNRPKWLKKCLQSIISQSRDFSLSGMEIIVVDNAACKHVKRIIHDFNLDVCYNKIHCIANDYNRGPGGARNAGLKLASGSFFAFIDDDCVLSSGFFKKCVDFLLSNQKCGAISGGFEPPWGKYVAMSSYMLEFSSWLFCARSSESANLPAHSIVYRRDAVDGLRFDEMPDTGYEDALFNMRVLSKGYKLFFSSALKIIHLKWLEKYKLKDFFACQRRFAKGFVRGGYKAHNQKGTFLYNNSFFLFFCPRLLLVAFRCLKSIKLSIYFVYCFPLLFAGEFYRAYCINRYKRSYV